MNSNEQIFWTFFITTICGFILAIGKMMYKSKCKEIHCCCIKIIRDIESEEKIDEIQLHAAPNTNNTNELDNTIVSNENQI